MLDLKCMTKNTFFNLHTKEIQPSKASHCATFIGANRMKVPTNEPLKQATETSEPAGLVIHHQPRKIVK